MSQLFQRYDRDKDGKIALPEFYDVVRELLALSNGRPWPPVDAAPAAYSRGEYGGGYVTGVNSVQHGARSELRRSQRVRSCTTDLAKALRARAA